MMTMNVMMGFLMGAVESSEFMGPRQPLLFNWLAVLLFYSGALLVTYAGTKLIISYKGNLGMDAPDGRRKLHENPVPRLGGAPIYLTLMLGIVAAFWLGEVTFDGWLPLILCNALIFSVGIADDLKPLGARVKLVGQIGAALILYSSGLSIDVLSNPFGDGGLQLGWWSLPLTLLWLVAIPNIINLIDGMDGLAGGFGLFLSLTLAFVGFVAGFQDVMIVSVIMAGALSGFLFFNFPPAKIFLGDGGAYLIGFFIASVSLKCSNKGSIIAALLVIVIALGVPILDTAFAILRRAIRGVPIFRADAEHIHHRLILLGYSKGRALVAMYSVCVVLSLVGISILLTKGVALPVAGAVLFLLAIGAARYLGYVRSWSNLRQQMDLAMQRRHRLEHTRAHARVLDFDIELCNSLIEFEDVFSQRLKWMGFLPPESKQSLPVKVYLSDGSFCILYRPTEEYEEGEWQRRADELVTVLERCLERWEALPSLLGQLRPVKTGA
ncbi:UDP-GlcNAc:undecaprenyl-phosphate GlcNAc-1-phosphate transferase [Prosthecobacter fusiformis]|uniref:UDP-GlcNAc:undecaprenyl-phosphate GlcNAc-1-phosphate transferase n=1 Tax=Prosthecobacter fusiformis TaxID=48464 RepID=A0A4R7RKC1_9BACT|nr:MraY family glycosyltransferase [Prosthecobacter fusiformis]TDU64647.1 UDP-GlcNAc:undecaprenyl-phosphate GlcNAc-1-phosphate transferase [Prosthecobacter fusiformis]